MRLRSIEAVIVALNEAGVRYLVAGGLAVNAHGYARLTADIDLVVALDADNVIRAFAALETIGYRPTVGVSARQFADAELRQRWIDEKGMKVLSFFSDAHPETPVDVFVYEPSTSIAKPPFRSRKGCGLVWMSSSSRFPP